MRTKIFIAVGSTASNGLSELISRLKECGIYRNDGSFKDQFIAIDTDSTAINAFKDSGTPQNVNGICIPPTRRSPNVPITNPAQDAETYIKPFNSTWTNENVAVARDGVFGYCRKSGADLSWVRELKRCIAQTYNPQRAVDYELVFVATSYGGSSSGLLMNVAEVARTCVAPATPSWCFLLLPSETLKRSQDYDQGWMNFLNMWQLMQQAVWERKLDGDKFTFPFYAGYAQGEGEKNLMKRKLFKIKESIRNYTPDRTGCHLPFNAVFPLAPNIEGYDSRFAAPAISELAMFLFYADAIRSMGDEGNLYAQGHDFSYEDERNFVGLRLVGARCSSYSTFYQKAAIIFRDACKSFLEANLEKTVPGKIDTEALLALEIQQIRELFENMRQRLVGGLTNGAAKKIFDDEIVEKDAYYEYVRRFVDPFPTLDEFVKSGKAKPEDDADMSGAWLIATYKQYYDDVKGISERYEGNKDQIRKILENLPETIDRYAKRFLSRALKKEESLTDSILQIGEELFVRAFEDFHRAAVAKASIELFVETQRQSLEDNKNTYAAQVHQWLLVGEKNMEVLNWNSLRTLLTFSDALDGDKQDKSMFVRNVLGDITTACQDYKIGDDPLQKIRNLLIKFMLSATFNGNNGGLQRIRGLQVEFDNVIEILIKDLQEYVSNRRAAGAVGECSIKIDLDDAQLPFWPTNDKIEGQSPCRTYFAKDGTSAGGIRFDIAQTKIREQLYDKFHLETFGTVVRDYELLEGRNPDCFMAPLGDSWTIKQDVPEKTQMNRAVDGCHWIENTPTRTNPAEDLFGLWVGEGCICMSAAEVIKSYLSINTLANVTSLKDLQSRMLFTLPEKIFYGMFIGIVKKKLDEAKARFKETNGYEVTIQNRVILEIKHPNGTQSYRTRPEGVTLEELGYDFGKNMLEAVPLDMMTALSKWFKRPNLDVNRGGVSDFAQALGEKNFNGMTAAVLEEILERKEVSIFQTNMSFGIDDKIKGALDALYEECMKLVSFEIKQ